MPRTVAKKTKPTATAFVEIRLSLGVPLGEVDSLVEAVEKSKELKVEGIIDFTDLEHNDSAMQVTGVYLTGVEEIKL